LPKTGLNKGASIGYKTAWGYTTGAILNRVVAANGMPLLSGGKAYVKANKATLTYSGKIVSYFKRKILIIG
jgi:hypothetical protein